MTDFRTAASAFSGEGAYLQVMQELHSRCHGRQFIYRGQPKEFSEDRGCVTSSLYRKVRDELGGGKPAAIVDLTSLEDYFVRKARRYFAGTSTMIEVYTLLRHFKAPLLLIDFSYDFNIALFFACDGHPQDPGAVFIRRGVDEPEDDIPADRSACCEILPAHLSGSRSRVQSQKSAFVYTPQGYLEAGDDENSPCFKITIEPALKPEILSYLENYHQINYETVYNDIFGFVANAPVPEWINLWAAQNYRDGGMIEQSDVCLKKVESGELMVREREKREIQSSNNMRRGQKIGDGGAQPAQIRRMWARINRQSEPRI